MKLLSRTTLVALLLAATVLQVLAGADYYALLGVSRNADIKEIKRAYRDLSKKYHPDKNPDNEEAHDKYVKIAEAYEVLSDDEKRRIYDQHGEEGLKQQQNQNNAGVFNPFESFFNFGRQQGQNKGADIVLPLEVSLEELYTGTMFAVEVNKRVICDRCRGTGAQNERDVETCSACGGRGVRDVRQQMAPGFVVQQQVQCTKCGGKGKIVKSKCNVCHGTKVRRGSSLLNVEVERGMSDGQEIVFERQADQSPDMTPGDVKFIIRQRPHPTFVREGDNLYIKIVLSVKEALLGFRREIKHLDDHVVVLERGQVTQPGFVQEIAGQGMPKHTYPSETGSLFVEYSVVLPASLTDEQKHVLQQVLNS